MKFEFFKRKEVAPKKSEKILPFDVRYALQHKEGRLNKNDIEALFNSGFISEAVYLTFKSLINEPEKHREFFEKYISNVLNENTLINKKEILRELVTETLKNLDEVSVKGNKLAQLSRQGFDLWQEKYISLATELSSEERNVYLLAHSTFIGIDAFLKAFSDKNKNLNILIPEWEKNEKFGYTINFDGEKANLNWTNKPFDNTKGAVLVDDTKNTGNTLHESEEFLIRNGSENPELKVINNAG